MFQEKISKNFEKVKEIAFSDLPIEEKMKLFESFDEIIVTDFMKGRKFHVKNCFLPIEGFEDYAINPFGDIIFGWLDGLHILSKNKAMGTVKLSKGRYDKKARRVHILVAETFLQNPESKKYVNFKDGNRDNIRLDNLEFDDAKRKTVKNLTKVSNVRKEKLSEDEIKQISAMLDAGETCKVIMKKFNVKKSIVFHISCAKKYGVNPLDLDIPMHTNQPKSVKCIENGKIYNSYNEAAKDLNLTAQGFRKYFNRVYFGMETDFQGYHFERIEEKEI